MREIVFTRLFFDNSIGGFGASEWLSVSKLIYDGDKLAPEPDFAYLNIHSWSENLNMDHIFTLDFHSNLISVNIPLLAPARLTFLKFSNIFKKIYDALHGGFLKAVEKGDDWALFTRAHSINGSLGFHFKKLSVIQIRQIRKMIHLMYEIPDPDDANFLYKFYTNTQIGKQYIKEISQFKFIQVVFDKELITLERKQFIKRKYLDEIVNHLDRESEYIIPLVIKHLIKSYHGEWLPLERFACFHCQRRRYRDFRVVRHDTYVRYQNY